MKTIKVCYGQLTKKLITEQVVEGTTVGEFANQMGLSTSNLRVNVATVNLDTKLKDNDIITTIDKVRGGITHTISAGDLLQSKVYVKEGAAIDFKHPKEYVHKFFDVALKHKLDIDAMRIIVNDKVVNAEEDGVRNIAYPRAMIETKMKDVKELPGFYPVVGMVYALDIQKPIIKVYSGFNVEGCVNLCIFNAEYHHQVELLGDYQSVYIKAENYFSEKQKEVEEFSQTLRTLESEFLEQKELDFYIGLILRKAMKSRLGTTNILKAVKELYNPNSSYYVFNEGTFKCSKFNLYNAITQQITDGNDIIDRARKTIEISKVLVENVV